MPTVHGKAFTCPRCAAALRAHRNADGVFAYFCAICHWGVEGLDPNRSVPTGRMLWNSPPARRAHLYWLWPITLILLAIPFIALLIALDGATPTRHQLWLTGFSELLYIGLVTVLPFDGEPNNLDSAVEASGGIFLIATFAAQYLLLGFFLLEFPGRLIGYTIFSAFHAGRRPPRSTDPWAEAPGWGGR